MASKKLKDIFVFSKTRVIIYLVLLVFIASSVFFRDVIEDTVNSGYKAGDTSNNIITVLDEHGLQVHFVDVGQGDGILIELPDGKTMIVDGGPSGNADNLLDYIDNNIFEGENNPYFDYMIITHSDTDHVGAIDEVLDAYQVNSIYRPEIYAIDENVEVAPEGKKAVTTGTYAKVIERVLEEPNCEVVFNYEGLTIEGGEGDNSYTFTFYSPMEHYYYNVNDFSPIIALEYRDKTVLLTGDASIDNEEEVVDKYDLPEVDVLKLGHHGSSTSTGFELLSEIDITYAIVSAGEQSYYGHPSEETINRLLSTGVNANNIFNTAENGNIIVNVNRLGEINIFTDIESLSVLNTYIYWEYLALSVSILLFLVLFGKKKYN